MKHLFLLILLLISTEIFSQTVSIRWKQNPGTGAVEVTNGSIQKLNAVNGSEKDKTFSFVSHEGDYVLEMALMGCNSEVGPEATIVHITTTQGNSFSFFLRDVQSVNPIFIPNYEVVILPTDDKRDYAQVEFDVTSKKLLSKIQKIEQEPEMSFDLAASKVRNMNTPIWLGLGRNMCLFEVEEELETNNLECKMIRPRFSGSPISLPESDNQTLFYRYALGRGVGIMNNVKRSLEQGKLPIYHSEMQDDDVKYHTVTFVTLGSLPLNQDNILGTDYYISDKYSPGRAFTEEQKQILEKRLTTYEQSKQDEIILCSKTIIENTGDVPRYAWIKTPQAGYGNWKYSFDSNTGFSSFSKDKVFCISMIDDKPMPNEEMAVLIQPGESVVYEFYLPHTPISRKQALQIASLDFELKYEECKKYWLNKLGDGAYIEVPEKRISEMIQAGLLHLDLITYGREPDAPLAANVGIYSPIGTESSPIMQFYMSMGWEEEAKRSIMYFLDTQQKSGLVANYSGYMIETGAVLWNIGEYYRYTRDRQWIKDILPNIQKACDYLISWRNENKKESLRGKGYGMIDGKVADPEDNYHQFMLNGYSCLGLKRMGEILSDIEPALSAKYKKTAEIWKEDIKSSLINSMSLSPVIPLGDGTWCPTVPPWPESATPRALYQQKGNFWSHGTFTIADALLGPLYLIYTEILDPEDVESKIIYESNSELFLQNNSAFSQPYYSAHNWYQVKKGMVKPFLNTYYTTMAATADRETYSFWEHLFKMTPHKTHEEANFLMDTRRMLYIENKDTLEVFKMIPRLWMEDGKQIILSDVKSYFGELDVKSSSHTDLGYIDVVVECHSERKPHCIKVRIPHPEGKKPARVEGGIYDSKTETIVVDNFNGISKIHVSY